MNKKRAKYVIMPFVMLIGSGFLLNLTNKDKENSFSENRALEQKPGIESIKDRTYTKKYEKYFSDQFIFREEIMTFYDKFKVLAGSNKIKNYYVLDNNWIMPTPTKELYDEAIKRDSDKIGKLTDVATESGKDVYYVSTPHKESVLSHLYPKSLRNMSKALSNRDRLMKELSDKNIKFINIDKYFLGNFDEKERENLYFKTDHHWNGVGAYEGFKYIVHELGLDSKIDWNDYKTSVLNKGSFLGSYNKNLNKLVKEKEEIQYVHNKKGTKYQYFKFDGKKDAPVKEEDVLATRRNEKEILYGGAYMFGNACNILKIKNNDAPINKKVLVFRDSYQSPTSWLFADVFSEVQLVDVRYIDKLNMTSEDIIKNSDADMVMFMYSDATFDELISKTE